MRDKSKVFRFEVRLWDLPIWSTGINIDKSVTTWRFVISSTSKKLLTAQRHSKVVWSTGQEHLNRHRMNFNALQLSGTQFRITAVTQSYFKTSAFISYHGMCPSFLSLYFPSFYALFHTLFSDRDCTPLQCFVTKAVKKQLSNWFLVCSCRTRTAVTLCSYIKWIKGERHKGLQ